MLASILYDYGRFSVEVKSTLLLGAYVQNCKQVFEENGLEYDQEDLLVAKGNDDFAKECYENMKNILSEVEG